MAQIQIGFGTVIGDEDFAVLVRTHGTRIHIEIGIEFLDCYPQAALLQQAAQRRCGNSLAQAGNYAAGDKNILDRHNQYSLHIYHNSIVRKRLAADFRPRRKYHFYSIFCMRASQQAKRQISAKERQLPWRALLKIGDAGF